MTRRVLWWIKRDARLCDNAALSAAVASGAEVLPVFCFEPSVTQADDSSIMHHHAQLSAVCQLRNRLKSMGAEVLFAEGEAVRVFQGLLSKFPFLAVYAHEEFGNGITFARDVAVARWCQERGIGYHEYPQCSVRRGGVNRDRLQALWQTRIVATPPIPPPTALQQSSAWREFASATDPPQLSLPASANQWQPVGENHAQRTLEDFLTRRSLWYRGGISSPNTADTAGSRLSVYLAWGTITTRQIWHATQARLQSLTAECHPHEERWRASLSAFLSRLHWRDHFTQRLESEPGLEYRSIHPSYRRIPYENSPALYDAWCAGRTGFPMVDAVMRCLADTGFVNFRMRAMVVSFACHALHLDWRLIHPHLARVFRDYDPGIHMNQLQMQAGVVGWNAIRVYDPAKQLRDWDKRATFVKRWMPELRDRTAEQLLAGDSGLSPVMDFTQRTQQMKDWLYGIRKSEAAQAETPQVWQRHGSRKQPMSFRPQKSRKSKPKQKNDTGQLRLFE